MRSAYLYRKLDEKIYMDQTKGFKAECQEHKVLWLQHTLYRLKQAGLTWWHILNKSMKELGFYQISFNARIFLHKDKSSHITIVIVYVDNTLFCGPNKAIVNKLKFQFMKK